MKRSMAMLEIPTKGVGKMDEHRYHSFIYHLNRIETSLGKIIELLERSHELQTQQILAAEKHGQEKRTEEEALS